MENNQNQNQRQSSKRGGNGRRASAIMEVKDLEYLNKPPPKLSREITPIVRQSFIFGPKKKKAEQISLTLQSGLMLNHCILYREISFESQSLNINCDERFPDSKKETLAFIATNIGPKNAREEYIPFKSAQAFLDSCLRKGTFVGDGFLWIHATDLAVIPLVFKECRAHSLALKIFHDTLPRATCNTFGNGSMVSSITSFCLEEEGIISTVKMYLLVKDNIFITHERRTHAALQEIDVEQSPRLIKSAIDPNATEAKEAESQPSPEPVVYYGKVYTKMKQILNRTTVQEKCESEGLAYLVYESVIMMLHITTSVVNFYSTQQLRLHDCVHVREQPPTHAEGNEILDTVDFIKAGFELMSNLVERSLKCLEDSQEKLETTLPGEWVSDMINMYRHAFDVIDDMDRELSHITDTINGIISRRNEQINIVLGLVATVFLPLTFITGIFGMNFTNGGFIVHVMTVHDGTDWFYGSCMICIVLCIILFVYKGWLDMLGNVRRGGRIKREASSKISVAEVFHHFWDHSNH